MEIYCKLDNLQRTGSFKERGAHNALAKLSPEQKKRGVIAASAGNHAQALAYQGKLLGVPATVVMPKFAPLIKVSNCQKLGATVVLFGKEFAEAKAHAHEIAEERGLAYIDGFDRSRRSSPARERWGSRSSSKCRISTPSSCQSAAAGLLAGVSLAVKTLRPEAKVIAVEADNVASFSAALEAGKPVRIPTSPTLADGLAIPQVGGNAFAIASEHTDRPLHRDRRTNRALDFAHRRAGERRRRRRGRDAARRLSFRPTRRAERASASCSCSAAATSIPTFSAA